MKGFDGAESDCGLQAEAPDLVKTGKPQLPKTLATPSALVSLAATQLRLLPKRTWVYRQRSFQYDHGPEHGSQQRIQSAVI